MLIVTSTTRRAGFGSMPGPVRHWADGTEDAVNLQYGFAHAHDHRNDKSKWWCRRKINET